MNNNDLRHRGKLTLAILVVLCLCCGTKMMFTIVHSIKPIPAHCCGVGFVYRVQSTHRITPARFPTKVCCDRAELCRTRLQCTVDSRVPTSPSQLVAERRKSRWDRCRSSLDWTRYHLDVVFIEAGGTGVSRIAAGLFERIARYHSCAGALPAEIGTTGKSVPDLPAEVAGGLDIGAQWLYRRVEEYDAPSLKFYDVVVCVDATTAEFYRTALRSIGEDPYPPHVLELADMGAYLEMRRPESPMKAWVPDWRAVIDPNYDERNANATAPLDDALAVWKELPEDLAQLVQPHYESVTSLVIDKPDSQHNFRTSYGRASITFHIGGLVRYLMDTYPLDLEGGPGYDGPP